MDAGDDVFLDDEEPTIKEAIEAVHLSGDFDALYHLMRRGPVHTWEVVGVDALNNAVRLNYAAIVRWLLDVIKVDPNIQCSACTHGSPALNLAAFHGEEGNEVALVLLDAGADPRIGCKVYGARALYIAACTDNPTLITHLLGIGGEFKVDVNATTLGQDHVTEIDALYAACASKSVGAIKALLAASPPPPLDAKRAGYTPLYAAAEVGCLAAVDILVRAGAALNTSCANNTALQVAVYGNHVDIVTFLLRHGADAAVLRTTRLPATVSQEMLVAVMATKCNASAEMLFVHRTIVARNPDCVGAARAAQLEVIATGITIHMMDYLAQFVAFITFMDAPPPPPQRARIGTVTRHGAASRRPPPDADALRMMWIVSALPVELRLEVAKALVRSAVLKYVSDVVRDALPPRESRGLWMHAAARGDIMPHLGRFPNDLIDVVEKSIAEFT
jgi:ankyrin repeat protein